MTNVREHYDALLGSIYVWMAGGLEPALATGAADMAEYLPGEGAAIDLGAGFGMHAIPLARGGYDVLALDTSAELLATLREQSAGLRVRGVLADLTDFRRYLAEPAALIVCCGDTLTHLESVAQVERLFADVAASLRPGGRLVLTFRDYTRLPTAEARFIPVRADADRIHTCFLEERPEHVLVHDIVHTRDGSTWRMKASSYPKLRLAPAAVAHMLDAAGLVADLGSGPRGMTGITATNR